MNQVRSLIRDVTVPLSTAATYVDAFEHIIFFEELLPAAKCRRRGRYEQVLRQ